MNGAQAGRLKFARMMRIIIASHIVELPAAPEVALSKVKRCVS